MADQERKKHTIRCTDQEWELIEKNAELANMSATQFLITKGTESSHPLILTPDEQTKLRRAMRLLAIEATVRYKEQGYTTEQIIEMSEG